MLVPLSVLDASVGLAMDCLEATATIEIYFYQVSPIRVLVDLYIISIHVFHIDYSEYVVVHKHAV